MSPRRLVLVTRTGRFRPWSLSCIARRAIEQGRRTREQRADSK